MPQVHVTNYQQYIDATYLHTIITDNLPSGIPWPENINVSIAYMDVKKKGVLLYGTIALSILGKAYKISMPVDEHAYLAKYGLDLNTYANNSTKDNHRSIFQRTFDGIVANKKQQIIKAITCAYTGYQPQTTYRR